MGSCQRKLIDYKKLNSVGLADKNVISPLHSDSEMVKGEKTTSQISDDDTDDEEIKCMKKELGELERESRKGKKKMYKAQLRMQLQQKKEEVKNLQESYDSGMTRSNLAPPYMANTENQNGQGQPNLSNQTGPLSAGIALQVSAQTPSADSGARNMPEPQNPSHGTGMTSMGVVYRVDMHPSAPPDENASDDLFSDMCRDISKLRTEDCRSCLQNPLSKTNLGNWVCKNCEEVFCDECQSIHSEQKRNHTFLNFNPKCGPCEKEIGIWHCTECSNYLCDECKSHHKSEIQWKSHTIVKSTEVVRRMIQSKFNL